MPPAKPPQNFTPAPNVSIPASTQYGEGVGYVPPPQRAPSSSPSTKPSPTPTPAQGGARGYAGPQQNFTPAPNVSIPASTQYGEGVGYVPPPQRSVTQPIPIKATSQGGIPTIQQSAREAVIVQQQITQGYNPARDIPTKIPINPQTNKPYSTIQRNSFFTRVRGYARSAFERLAPPSIPYSERKAPDFQPKPTQSRGTVQYQQTPTSQLPPLQRYEREVQQEAFKQDIQLMRSKEEIQERINRGEISLEQGQKELDTKVNQANKSFVKFQENKASETEVNIAKSRIPITLLESAGYGLVSVVAPPVGVALAGAGLGRLVTQPREPINKKATAISVGASVVGGVAGGIVGGRVVKGIETKAGYPRYQVRFISRAKTGDQLTKAESKAVIKEENLLRRDRVFIAESQELVKSIPSDAEFSKLVGLSRGKIQEVKGISFPSTKPKVSKPIGFAEKSISVVKEGDQILEVPVQKGVKLSKEFPGSEIITIAQTKIGRSKPSLSLSRTKTIQPEEGIQLSAGKSAPIIDRKISTRGRSRTQGITYLTPEEETGSFSLGGNQKLLKKINTVDLQATQSLQRIAQRSFPQPKKIGKAPLKIQERIKTTTFTPQTSGLQQRIEQAQKSITIIKPRSTERIKVNQLSLPKYKTSSINKQSSNTIQKFNQRNDQSFRQLSAQITQQTPRQITIGRLRNPTNPSNIPFLFPPKIKDGVGSKKQIRKVEKKLNRLTSKYTSSLGAAAFQAKPIGISKKEYQRLSKKVYTGFETRPVVGILNDKPSKKVKFNSLGIDLGF